MNKNNLVEDQKIYVRGRAQLQDEEAKLICEKIVAFEDAPKELWIQFENKEAYRNQEAYLLDLFETYHDEYTGAVPTIIYCKQERAINRLSRKYYVKRDEDLLAILVERYGEANVRVKEKGIEFLR